MTIITRYPTALTGADIAGLDVTAWDSGLNPNQRWLPGKLPAVGADNVNNWASKNGGLLVPTSTPKPSTAAEAGWRYADFDGVSDNLQISPTLPANVRTIMIIARPNVGDTYTGAGFSASGGTMLPFVNTTDLQWAQSVNNETANIVGWTPVISAPRGHWHMYAASIPDSGAGVFVVDNNSVVISASAPRNQTKLLIGQSGAMYRQMRVLEVLTSADVFSAAQLFAAYARAKAWYSELTW